MQFSVTCHFLGTYISSANLQVVNRGFGVSLTGEVMESNRKTAFLESGYLGLSIFLKVNLDYSRKQKFKFSLPWHGL